MEYISSQFAEFHKNQQEALLKKVCEKHNINSLAKYSARYCEGESLGKPLNREYHNPENFANSVDAKSLYRCYPEGDNTYMFLTNNPGTANDTEHKLNRALGGGVNETAGLSRVFLVEWLLDLPKLKNLFEDYLSEIATKESLSEFSDWSSYIQEDEYETWLEEVKRKMERSIEEATRWIRDNPDQGPSLNEGFYSDFAYDVGFNLESKRSNDLNSLEEDLAKEMTDRKIGHVDPNVIIASGNFAWTHAVRPNMEDVEQRGIHKKSGDCDIPKYISDAKGGAFECTIGGKRRTVLALKHPRKMTNEGRKHLQENAAALDIF